MGTGRGPQELGKRGEFVRPALILSLSLSLSLSGKDTSLLARSCTIILVYSVLVVVVVLPKVGPP